MFATVQVTKAISHLLQCLLNCLNFQQEQDEAERKQNNNNSKN